MSLSIDDKKDFVSESPTTNTHTVSSHAPGGIVTSLSMDDKKDFVSESPSTILGVPPPSSSQRPPIDYSSFPAFIRSTRNRFVSLWTRRFVFSLLAGQIVSLCITCTNVTTTELVTRNWALPTTQTFFLSVQIFFLYALGKEADSASRYLGINLIYTPYTMYKCKKSLLTHLCTGHDWLFFLVF